MYKLEINLGGYDWVEGEKLVVESLDFEKIQVIQEFIEAQLQFNWSADWDLIESDEDEDEEEEDEEDEEDEEEEVVEAEVGEVVEDEEGAVWERVA